MQKKISGKIARRKIVEQAKKDLKKVEKVVGAKISKAKSTAKKTLKSTSRKAVSFVKKNPKKIAAIGAGVGLALGTILIGTLKRKKKS